LLPPLLIKALKARKANYFMGANNQMPCDFCSVPYDPVSTRWLCPNCHMKTNCCDGAPCEILDSKVDYQDSKS